MHDIPAARKLLMGLITTGMREWFGPHATLKVKTVSSMFSLLKFEVWADCSTLGRRREGKHDPHMLPEWWPGEAAPGGLRLWYTVKIYCKTLDLLMKDSVMQKVGSSIATLLSAGTPDPVLSKTLKSCARDGMTRVEVSHHAPALHNQNVSSFE
jgi:hypothetical protein